MINFIDEIKDKREKRKSEKEETRKQNLKKFYDELEQKMGAPYEVPVFIKNKNSSTKYQLNNDLRKPDQVKLKYPDKKDQKQDKDKDQNKIFKKVNPIVEKVPNVDSVSVKKEDNIYKLTIVTKDGNKNSFLVDDGTLMGGTMVSILLNLKNDDFFIPVEKGYEDILIKGLSGNLITEEDVKRVRKNFFPNLALYGAFDFSNTAKIDEIKKSGDDFNKLNNILTTIYMNNLTKANNVPADMPRMRFTYLKNYNDLEVVSDDKVKPGLSSEYNKTMLKIIPGEKYIVNERGIFHYKDGVCLESTPLNVAPANTEAPIIMNNPQPQYYAMQNPYFQMPVAVM